MLETGSGQLSAFKMLMLQTPTLQLNMQREKNCKWVFTSKNSATQFSLLHIRSVFYYKQHISWQSGTEKLYFLLLFIFFTSRNNCYGQSKSIKNTTSSSNHFRHAQFLRNFGRKAERKVDYSCNYWCVFPSCNIISIPNSGHLFKNTEHIHKFLIVFINIQYWKMTFLVVIPSCMYYLKYTKMILLFYIF